MFSITIRQEAEGNFAILGSVIEPKHHRHIILLILGFLLIIVGVTFLLWGQAGAPSWKFLPGQSSEPETTQPTFDKQQFSLDDPASLWVVTNKQRPLPASYTPSGLRQPSVPVRASGSNEMLLRDEAASGVEQMVTAAASQGISLMLVSGYRSYGLQQAVYGGNVAREGQANADKTSARPGHSEHQTGLAADLGLKSRQCELDQCFGQTAGGKWLAEHAHEYGFVVRYPDGQQGVVGYTYEPWHMRFVGKELAAEVQKSGQTLEQFFGLPNAPNY